MTSLNDTQKQHVREWIQQGSKLAEIQKRLSSEFGLTLTYMEVRFVVDDLKLVPKDPEPPKVPDKPPTTAPASSPETLQPESQGSLDDASVSAEPPVMGGTVTVSADAIARPGSIASGRVKFSDGQSGAWLVDQYGRPGFVPDTKGYRPTPGDMQQFQMGLERELAKLGI